MKTEIMLRKQAVALHLQGLNKSEIARKVQRSRRWVQCWIGRYKPDAPTVSFQACSLGISGTDQKDGNSDPSGTYSRVLQLLCLHRPNLLHINKLCHMGSPW